MPWKNQEVKLNAREAEFDREIYSPQDEIYNCNEISQHIFVKISPKLIQVI